MSLPLKFERRDLPPLGFKNEVDIGKWLLQTPGFSESAQQVDVLGLDLSLNSTGYAYIKKGSLYAGLIVPKDYKLGRISSEMAEVLLLARPTLISVEDMLRQSKRFTAMDVGAGTGAAMSQVERYQMARLPTPIPILRQTPDRLKYFVRRKADTEKKHLIEYVFKIFTACGYDPKDYFPKAQKPRGDMCDAITAAVSGIVAFGVYRGIIPESAVHEWFYVGSENYKDQLRRQYAIASD